jgi:hypothetical protein
LLYSMASCYPYRSKVDMTAHISAGGRTELFWIIMQRLVVIYYQSFGTT